MSESEANTLEMQETMAWKIVTRDFKKAEVSAIESEPDNSNSHTEEITSGNKCNGSLHTTDGDIEVRE
jgi:hypothetical protein